VLLNAGCGTHYAAGWVNCDVWSSSSTRPDVVVESGVPYPFSDGSCDAVFLGHVLEHVEWGLVPAFLGDMFRLLRPGGWLLVVGPDVFKTIRRWGDGLEPWGMVLSTLEHAGVNWQPGREGEVWGEAAHHWNCHHDRVVELLSGSGFVDVVDVFDRIPNDVDGVCWEDDVSGVVWPVVGKWFWQCAVLCRRPL